VFAQPYHFPFFVENTVGTVALDLGDGEPDRIRPDVDSGQPGLDRRLVSGHK
jgi:hypothetical protein